MLVNFSGLEKSFLMCWLRRPMTPLIKYVNMIPLLDYGLREYFLKTTLLFIQLFIILH